MVVWGFVLPVNATICHLAYFIVYFSFLLLDSYLRKRFRKIHFELIIAKTELHASILKICMHSTAYRTMRVIATTQNPSFLFLPKFPSTSIGLSQWMTPLRLDKLLNRSTAQQRPIALRWQLVFLAFVVQIC